MRRHRHIRRGFTLVELIATMTILAALGSVVSLVIATSVDGYTRAATTAQLNSEISVALEMVTRAVRRWAAARSWYWVDVERGGGQFLPDTWYTRGVLNVDVVALPLPLAVQLGRMAMLLGVLVGGMVVGFFVPRLALFTGL